MPFDDEPFDDDWAGGFGLEGVGEDTSVLPWELCRDECRSALDLNGLEGGGDTELPAELYRCRDSASGLGGDDGHGGGLWGDVSGGGGGRGSFTVILTLDAIESTFGGGFDATIVAVLGGMISTPPSLPSFPSYARGIDEVEEEKRECCSAFLPSPAARREEFVVVIAPMLPLLPRVSWGGLGDGNDDLVIGRNVSLVSIDDLLVSDLTLYFIFGNV